MAAGNAFGERLPMFVIGKSEARCFKGVRHIPCRYRAQEKSLMDSELIEEWVNEVDGHLSVQKRKVALIIDNCPDQPKISGLQWVEFIFLPPNTTSVTQSMDQGVIRSPKAKYHFLAVKKATPKFEKKVDSQNFQF